MITIKKRILCCFFIACCLSFAQAQKPNIIVIYTDDHGYADLSAQGVFTDVKTPNIDMLAKNGVRMTDGYSSAPQCVPSRAGLLTGRYQNRFGLESNGGNLDGFNNSLTIAERLKTAGYATGMAGKWHLGGNEEIVDHGFDWAYHKHSGVTGISNYDLQGNERAVGEVTHAEGYHLDVCTDASIAFINNFKDQPFFFYLAYRAPHVPLDAPKKYLDRFPGEMPERRRQALAMLSSVDDGVGRIMETLRQHDLEENTLIFIIGDNGAPLKITKEDAPGGGPGWDGSLNDPMNGEKGMLTEGGIRVPFAVYWKGTIPGNQIYSEPVISLDVAATAVELAGLEKAPELDGVNLIPYLTGDKQGAPHDKLYWRWIGQSTIRRGDWKYLRGDNREYLFNLRTDFEECTNLISEHHKKANELRTLLNEWDAELPPFQNEMSNNGKKYFDWYLDREGSCEKE